MSPDNNKNDPGITNKPNDKKTPICLAIVRVIDRTTWGKI